MSQWKRYERYQLCQGKQCQITLERRPYYCDRGDFLAKLFPDGALARDIDAQDGWPRYYFDEDRAKAEIEAWLKKRRQWIADAAEKPDAEPMQILALVADGRILIAIPDGDSDSAFQMRLTALRAFELGDAIGAALDGERKSMALLRFRAVELLQQFPSDEEARSQ